MRNRDAPVVLRLCDDVGEIRIEEQIVQRRIARVGFGDAIQKFRANDATAAPDRGDVAEIQIPIVSRTRGAEQFHSLRVGNDFRSVKRVVHRLDELLAIAGEFLRLRLRQNFRGLDALVFARRNHARFDRGVDGGDHDRLRERRLQRPKSGPFLAGLVEDHIDERLACVRIFLAENLRSDFDEITFERAAIPFRENFGELFSRRDRGRCFKNRVRFADQLHVAVLDSVVHHLYIMAGAIRSHVTAARFAIDLRGDLAEDRRDDFPRFARTAGHERRTFERAFFAAGNAAADKVKSASFEIFAAPLRVGEKRIAAVDDDVAFFQKRRELPDDRIDRRAGFDHDHRFARPRSAPRQILPSCPQRMNVLSAAASGMQTFPSPHGCG